jgi:hypothetical protein
MARAGSLVINWWPPSKSRASFRTSSVTVDLSDTLISGEGSLKTCYGHRTGSYGCNILGKRQFIPQVLQILRAWQS